MTKRELNQAVMDGRRFTLESTYVHEKDVIHWDDKGTDYPVRKGIQPWNWRGFKYLHEITESQWYDNIPEEGVLCWVWDKEEGYKGLDTVLKYESGDGLGFITTYSHFNHATPILPSECYQESV